jgi:hypothetical protein
MLGVFLAIEMRGEACVKIARLDWHANAHFDGFLSGSRGLGITSIKCHLFEKNRRT